MCGRVQVDCLFRLQSGCTCAPDCAGDGKGQIVGRQLPRERKHRCEEGTLIQEATQATRRAGDGSVLRTLSVPWYKTDVCTGGLLGRAVARGVGGAGWPLSTGRGSASFLTDLLVLDDLPSSKFRKEEGGSQFIGVRRCRSRCRTLHMLHRRRLASAISAAAAAASRSPAAPAPAAARQQRAGARGGGRRRPSRGRG